MKNLKYTLFVLFFSLLFSLAYSQEEQPQLDVSKLKREDVMKMTYDDLIELPLETLMQLADIVGASSIEELYEMILNAQVTAASKKAESSFDSPLSTSVLSREDIERSGATCIEEALRLVPGIIVRQKTNGNYDVHIRGNDNVPPGNMLLYSENSISLVMIDGRVVYNYAHGGTFWEALPVDINDVERIEVVRGPASALYGPNAVSGVINIITKRPQDKEPHVDANLQMGNQNTKMGNVSSTIGITDKLSARVSGNYQYMDRFQETFYRWKWEDQDKYADLATLQNTQVPGTLDNYERDTNNLKYPDPSLGRERYGVNGWIYYDLNEDVNMTLGVGTQQSNVITTPLDNPYYSLTRRVMESEYIDFQIKAGNLVFHHSYNFGKGEAAANSPEFTFDYNTINNNLEYDWKIKNLSVRPGINMQRSFYDDSRYTVSKGLPGFLNGNHELFTLAPSLRLDYLYKEKLRLIAALRVDKYNYPDDYYPSYQFISSYKLNDKNLVRAVYSKANRSPFVVDLYANYNWEVITPWPGILDNGGHYYFWGNKDMEMLTQNMFELGYRAKPNNKLQLDLEGFYSITKNFDMFTLDTTTVRVIFAQNPLNPSSMVRAAALPEYGEFSYKNQEVESHQMGFTASAITVINENLYFKVFGTFQVTQLKNYNPIRIENSIRYMQNEAISSFREVGTPDTIMDPEMGMLVIRSFTGNYQPDSSLNQKHTSTPSFYGGFMVNYSPLPKLTVNTSLYTYGKQTFSHSFESIDVDPKLILSLKVSYKVWKENSVFINARNVLNNKTKEFAFVDDIGGLYMGGLSIHF